jgi:hypothetical protein
MGRIRKWGNASVRWFRTLPMGKKFAVSLGMVVVTYLIVVPISNVIYLTVVDERASNQVEVWCDPQGRETVNGQETPKVTVSRDDPRFDESDLEATMFVLCATSVY